MMLSFLTRAFLLRRLFGASQGHRGRRHRRHGRHRPRGGFGMTGPFPTYSRRTRRGSRVSVGGCCLPIPLVLTMGAAGLGRAAVRRGR